MLSEQPIADAADAGARVRIAGGRIHGEIAFRVHAHRAARQVGRPDPHQPSSTIITFE